MPLVLENIDLGTVPGDGTGDPARTGGGKVNSNNTLIAAAIDELQGRFWTIQNTSTTLTLGKRYKANNHAGITFTLPATFAQAADSLSDVWVANMGDAANVTLTPAAGCAFFKDGITLDVDVSFDLQPGSMAMLSPRTPDSEWDLLVVNGGAGDFKADGSVDMTGQFHTDVGTFESGVSNSIGVVAYLFDTQYTLNQTSQKLARFSNNGTPIFDFSVYGGISFVNSGATTEPFDLSLNLNWYSDTDKTSSGALSTVIGQFNKATGQQAFALGAVNFASGTNALAGGGTCTVSGDDSFAWGANINVSGIYSAAFGRFADVTNRCTFAVGGADFDAGLGASQVALTNLYVKTTGAVQTEMKAQATNFVIPADATWGFTGIVTARSDEADGNVSAAWKFEGVLYRDESGNTVIQGVTVTTIYSGFSTAAVAVQANNSTETLAIKVTGEAATNIRWSAAVTVAQALYV